MQEDARRGREHHLLSNVLAWSPTCAAAVILLGGAAAYHFTAGEQRDVSATVQSAAWRLNQDTGQHYPFIEAKLLSGRSVRVGSLGSELPKVGTRITIRQRKLLFKTMAVYEWDGPVSASADTAPKFVPASVAIPAPLNN